MASINTSASQAVSNAIGKSSMLSAMIVRLLPLSDGQGGWVVAIENHYRWT